MIPGLLWWSIKGCSRTFVIKKAFYLSCLALGGLTLLI